MESKLGVLVVSLFFIAGCASMDGFPPQTAQETEKIDMDDRIEITLEPESFDVSEVEFQVQAADIPINVLKRAREMGLEGEIEACEIEYHGESMYYEVSATIKGYDQEIMLTPDGKIHRWEIQVDPQTVPREVMAKAESYMKGGLLKKAEQILDASQVLVEYHLKMEKMGKKYKLVVPLSESPVVVYRETLAEIEVPVH